MLNFAEQTGSGAVIVVWSFLAAAGVIVHTYTHTHHIAPSLFLFPQPKAPHVIPGNVTPSQTQTNHNYCSHSFLILIELTISHFDFFSVGVSTKFVLAWKLHWDTVYSLYETV